MTGRILITLTVCLAACTSDRSASVPPTDTLVTASPDSSFEAMDHRHGDLVGADPSALAHKFVSTPDGGDVILERKAGDPLTLQQIRTHLEGIARAFSTGDFTTPAFVHEKNAAGADVMARKAGAITYRVEDIANGSVLRIRTADAEALQAVHRFIQFQTHEHRTGG